MESAGTGDTDVSVITVGSAVTVGDFVRRLFELRFRSAAEDILRYGHYRGWLEDQDERHPEAPLNRQTAARIIHQFLQIECYIPDLQDITPATRLKDLYTCRVCANHIAQVYTRGIMNAQEFVADDHNTVLLFNHLAPVSTTEAETIYQKITEVFQLLNLSLNS